MPQVSETYEWRGRNVVTSDGDKIGRLEEIYLDTESGEPEWATVTTGLFGTQQTFVPLAHVDHQGGEVVVPYSKGQVKDAPSVDPDGQLSQRDGSTVDEVLCDVGQQLLARLGLDVRVDQGLRETLATMR